MPTETTAGKLYLCPSETYGVSGKHIRYSGEKQKKFATILDRVVTIARLMGTRYDS